MANIGKLALQITANASALYKTLTDSTTRVGGWAKNVGGMLRSGLASYLSNSVSGKIGGKMGGMFSGILDSLKLVGGGILAALGIDDGSFTGTMIDKLNELFPMLQKSKALGVASDEFIGLANNMKRFGVETDDTYKSLLKFGAATNVKMPDGIDAEKWASADIIGRFELWADVVGGMPNVAEQAAAAQEVLGKKFAMMLPLLQQGAKGIRDFTEKQKALGLAPNQADADALIRAKMALPKLAMMFEGFKTRILVAFAPLLEFFANRLGASMGPLQAFLREVAIGFRVFIEVAVEMWKSIGALIDRVFEWGKSWVQVTGDVPTTAEIVYTAIHAIGAAFAWAWDTAKAGAGVVAVALGFVADVLGSIAEAIGWVLQNMELFVRAGAAVASFVVKSLQTIIGAGAELAGPFVAVFKAIILAASPVIAVFVLIGKAVVDLTSTLMDAFTWLGKKLAGIMDSLGDFLEEILPEGIADGIKGAIESLSEEGAKLVPKGLFDITDNIDKIADNVVDKLDKWGKKAEEIGGKMKGAGEAMKGWGADIFGEWGDSAVVMRDQIDEWIDAAERNRKAAGMMKKTPLGEPGRFDPAKTAAMLSGSKEAYSVETRFRIAGMSDAKNIQERQLDEQKKANQLLDGIKGVLDKLDRPADAEVGVV